SATSRVIGSCLGQWAGGVVGRYLDRGGPEPLAPGSEASVPEIFRFLGIVIQMYFREKHEPHFQARYSGRKAAIEIETLGVMSGRLPPRPRALSPSGPPFTRMSCSRT